MDLIKVLLVIETPLIGSIFASALEDEPDIQVASCVTTLQAALEFIQQQELNIVLLSVGLPDQGALTLTRAIVDTKPKIRVLAFGLQEDDRLDTLRYIEAGAAGYILKDSSLSELLQVIRLVQSGEAHVSTKMAGVMMERLAKFARMFSVVEHKMDWNARLTSREMEVLHFIGEGLSNQQIAARLVVEIGTVKNHVHSILEKLNVRSRDEAASYLAFVRR